MSEDDLRDARRALERGEPGQAWSLLAPLADGSTDEETLILGAAALERLGRADEALALLTRGAPHLATAAGYLGIARLHSIRKDRAARDRALASARDRFPERADVLRALADAAEEDGDLLAAITHLEHALALQPLDGRATQKLGVLSLGVGRVEAGVAALDRAARTRPLDSSAARGVLFASHYVDWSRQEVFDAHVRWATRFAQVEAHLPRRSGRGPRLRLGYVSADFRDHAVMRFLGRVLVEHDRSAWEIHAFSTTTRPMDEVTERVRALDLVFHDLAGLSPRGMAMRIADARIDVLVDLGGHTDESGLEAFAYRPASTQLSWLGYPDTTGMDGLGRVTDEIADPPGAESFHTERLLRLPCCAWNYASLDVPVLPRREGAPLTLGSFNALAKLSPSTLDAWARILAEVPEARLLLSLRSSPRSFTEAWLHEAFGQRGIDASRVTFRAQVPRRTDHLASHHELDLALDPFPYNGTTTTCDALWMGVPVVTLRGDRHVARVGASLLHHLGLGDLVAGDVDGYVALAVALARDPARRAELRRELRPHMLASTISNAGPFTRTLEATYREEHAAACRNSAPDGTLRVRTPWGAVTVVDDLRDPTTWRVREHRGSDEPDAKALQRWADAGAVLELGAGVGALSLVLTGSPRLCVFEPIDAHLRCLSDTLRDHRIRELSREGFAAGMRPGGLLDDGAPFALVRAEAVAPFGELWEALSRGPLAPPVVALRMENPGWSDEAATVLVPRGYRRAFFDERFLQFVETPRSPSHPRAHAWWFDPPTWTRLREGGQLIAPEPWEGEVREALAGMQGSVPLRGGPSSGLPPWAQAFLVSASPQLSLGQRWWLRLRAATGALDGRLGSAAERMTAARCLADVGWTVEAADVLVPLLEAHAWDPEPEGAFLSPLPGYDHLPHGSLETLRAQALGAFLLLASPTGAFQPDDVLDALGQLERAGASLPEHDRRFGLCLARRRALEDGTW